ncbi:MAG: helix-turn-helix domain-containing protein [Methanolinea sp.]|nr:helix-turn-helix domain-containing protein [Methanolinea sp.]
MCTDTGTICICGLGGIFSTISKKWALLIINRLGMRGRLRFSDLMDELAGISPKTLSDTLKELQEENLVGRESFAEVPPRVEYFLTEEGKGLRQAIIPLLEWASRRDSEKVSSCTVPCRKSPCFTKKGKGKGGTGTASG